jgi:hypothetical protein
VAITVPNGICENYDTFCFASVAGVMEVEVSGDGTTFLATKIALIDLTSTTPSTAVVVTTAGKSFGFSGKYRAVRLLQNGGTAVTGAFINAYQRGS